MREQPSHRRLEVERDELRGKYNQLFSEHRDLQLMFAAAILAGGGRLSIPGYALAIVRRDLVLNREDDPKSRGFIYTLADPPKEQDA